MGGRASAGASRVRALDPCRHQQRETASARIGAHPGAAGGTVGGPGSGSALRSVCVSPPPPPAGAADDSSVAVQRTAKLDQRGEVLRSRASSGRGGEKSEELAVERWDVVGLAAGDQTIVTTVVACGALSGYPWVVSKARLSDYRSKRDTEASDEPPGGRPGGDGPVFVVQRHDASRLHFDFRLEVDGVLASWAVPKGPSLDPRDKRLAVQVEDHSLDHADFEGRIGEGTVIVWDTGTYETSPRRTADRPTSLLPSRPVT